MSVLGNNLLAQYYAQSLDSGNLILTISTEAQREFGFRFSTMAATQFAEIDWGDGTKETKGLASYSWGDVVSHTYSEAKTYKVVIKCLGDAQIRDFRPNAAVGNSAGDIYGYAAMIAEVVKWDERIVNVFNAGNGDGRYAFANCVNAIFPRTLPKGTRYCSRSIFMNCHLLELDALQNEITGISSAAFSGCSNLALDYLPNGVDTLAHNCFAICNSLGLRALPNAVTSIGNGGFSRSTVYFDTFPASLQTLGDDILNRASCPSTMTFLGTPASISNIAFRNSVVTTIRVPWSEGEVANAPWGAQNATIVYNYHP